MTRDGLFQATVIIFTQRACFVLGAKCFNPGLASIEGFVVSENVYDCEIS